MRVYTFRHLCGGNTTLSPWLLNILRIPRQDGWGVLMDRIGSPLIDWLGCCSTLESCVGRGVAIRESVPLSRMGRLSTE